MSTLSRDAFVGGALNKADLLEIMQMEIEMLSVKSKSQEGVARDDLKPLTKAISDARTVGLGSDNAVKRAVEFKMSITRQLVIQQDVKTALINRNLVEMKAALEKAKSVQLKTRLCRELEFELVKVQKETLKKLTEENQKLKQLQSPTPPPSSQSASAAGAGGQAEAPAASSGRFFFKRAAPAPTAPPMKPDHHALTDTSSSSSDRKSNSFSKKLFGLSKSTSANPTPPTPTSSNKEHSQSDGESNSSPFRAQSPSSVLNELHRQAQYDLLVEAMQRVKLVLDSSDDKVAPGSILKAAGDDVELVTGDARTVHIWMGEYHGVVKSSAISVSLPNSRTVLVGEIDSKNTDHKWEIRILAGTTPVASSSLNAAREELLRQQIALLEHELKQAKEIPGVRAAWANVKALLGPLAYEKREEVLQETERSPSDRVDGNTKNLSAQTFISGEKDLVPIDVMTIKELKVYVLEKGGSVVGVTEKDELVKIASGLRETALATSPNTANTAAAQSPHTPSSKPPPATPTSAHSHQSADEDDGGGGGGEEEESGLQWKDHDKYGKYFRMLKVGLDKDTVKHKMTQDGLDPSVLNLDPESLVSARPKSQAEILESYLQMIRVGVPRAVVEYRMRSKGLDPSLLDGGSGEDDIPRLAIEICEDERFTPFLLMLGFGIPKDSVKIEMQTKGLDGDILDMDPNDFSPVDGTNVKRKSKKKDDGHQWKRLFWQPIKLEKAARGIWAEDMGFELVDGEKHEIKQWFALKMSSANDAALAAAQAKTAKDAVLAAKSAKDAALAKSANDAALAKSAKDATLAAVLANDAALAAALAKSAKPETVQVLEGPRAQNVLIVLSKFRIQIADLKRMIVTMKVPDGLDLTSDDVKSILSMLPTPEEAEKLHKIENKDTLGAAEKHFLGLLEVPRYKQRIACFLFKLQFNEVKQDLEFDLGTLGKAVLQVLESKELRRLFNVILALGNHLNSMGGLLNEEEDGFQPVQAFKLTSSLAKIKLSKAHGSPKNMLNFLETVLFKRQRRVLEYVLGEVDGIRAASTVVLSNVKAQIKGLAMGVKELENEVNFSESVRADPELSKKITPDDELFFNSVESFFQKARRDVHDLAVGLEKAETNFTELVQYVREDAETTPEIMFKALVQFFDEVHVAHEENTVARVKAQKLLGKAPVVVEEEVAVEEEEEEEEEDFLDDRARKQDKAVQEEVMEEMEVVEDEEDLFNTEEEDFFKVDEVFDTVERLMTGSSLAQRHPEPPTEEDLRRA